MPEGTYQARQINRNATKARLFELGFTGARVTMDARDYALIDLSELPAERAKVAEAYFEATSGYHREPEIDGYQWGTEI